MAISALINKQVARIVLTRPAVEAGERLGFLPGTLQEKVDPYLRPLYDALYDMLDSETVEKLLERNVIEVAPIAFMRGRTLNDSFIILDEAQNSTPEQMKMVLTRQGFNSKMVVNGDVTQIDLPNARRSGLIEATEVLRGVEGISFVQFDEKDVVRHTLVQRIVKAYEKYNETIGAGRQLTLKLTTGRAAKPSSGPAPKPLRRPERPPCPPPEGSSVTFRRVAGGRASSARSRSSRASSSARWPRAARFDCLITGDAELRRLNRDFRGKDYATDVLSFPVAAAAGEPHLGDLAISAGARPRPGARIRAHHRGRAPHPDAARRAAPAGHGPRDRQRRAWRARKNAGARELGLPNGLIERAQS